MLRRGCSSLAVAGVLALAAGSPAFAQTVFAIPTSVTFAPPGPPEFDQGYILLDQTVQVVVFGSINRNFRLTLQAASNTFDFGGKPASDLAWSLDGSTWNPVTSIPAGVATGRLFRVVTVRFRVRLDWAADVPGTYNVPVVFRAEYI